MTAPSAPLTAAVVGARTVRQGIGPHLARFVAAEGVRVTAIAGTTAATAAEAARDLERVLGARPAAYDDVPTLLRKSPPDLLVVASPHETHAPFLRLALEAGCHVLAEKPLCWGGPDPAAEAEALAAAFVLAGRHLVVNCQWPHTLPTYRRLHPDALRTPPATFEMRLSPRSRGARMLPDALPHVLSLLDAVLPDPGAVVEEVRRTPTEADGGGWDVRFAYRARGRRVDVAVVLRRMEHPPREAAYAFDGLLARRRVDVPGYRMRFEGEGRTVPLPDPTPLLVAEWVRRVRAGERPSPDPAAVPGVRNLARLCAGVEDA